MSPNQQFILNRSIGAITIPEASVVTLPVGTDIIITQLIGGVYTAATPEGLVRIDEKDADAFEPRGANPFILEVSEESSDMSDEDRIDCPFCGKMHYPGSGTAYAGEWTWDEDSICEHFLFLALDISAYTGFQFRSKLFNHHLGLPDSADGELMIPSKDDPEEYLSVSEIIDLVTLPGLELRSYEDPGGIACGPCGGGTVTFGFVPVNTSIQ